MKNKGSGTRFARGTCNTIDDVTGLIVKLNQTSKRWDNVQCTWENMEPRQPQDFPVTPRPQTVYIDARPDTTPATPTAYNPSNGWSYSV
jgi:hypothetical protein